MEENIVDEVINGHRPIPMDLANKTMKSICKVIIEDEKGNATGFGTGFFIRISDSLKYLFSNYHVISSDLKEIKIYIWNQKCMIINFDERDMKYFKDPIDITIIQIKESDILYKDIEFLDYDSNYKNKGYMIYKNVDVFSIEHPFGQIAACASGKIIKINGNEFEHDIPTEKGSSGSPIILLSLNLNLIQVIGIHKNANYSKKINGGSFIGVIINEINNNLNKIQNEYLIEEIKKSIDKDSNNNSIVNISSCQINNAEIDSNYIISEIIIDKETEIQIINSYEEQDNNEIKYNLCKRMDRIFISSSDKLKEELKNEKEIKECEIKINDKLIPFNYIHKFKKGNYIIKYSFKKYLNKANHMFCCCKYLKHINLSNLKAYNITNMSKMFSGCESLISIDLSNLNVQNVKDMNRMFSRCNSLMSIDLSNLNAQNVEDMSSMFSGCKSLKYVNLSNFKTKNLKYISNMFSFCNSLDNVNLSNFNTENVTDMDYLFCECISLKSVDLSNFNTKNTVNMHSMFEGCSSLESLDLSYFNTQNVTKMNMMFYDCHNLKSLNLLNFNVENINDYGMFIKCSSLNKENIIAEDNRIFESFSKCSNKSDDCNII